MSDDLELESEEFYRSALAFIPVTESIETVTSTSRDGSAALAGHIGSDEMGTAFADGYDAMRTNVLINGGKFATSFDGFREAFVDARDEYVEQDDANGELHAIVGREITTESGQKVTPQSGVGLLPNGDGTSDTPEDIADDLNTIEDAREQAEDDAEENYS